MYFRTWLEAQTPFQFYTGTSEAALRDIQSGRHQVRPVFKDSNVSLGGAYLTTDSSSAEVYARRAAKEHGSEGVILVVKPLYPLHPDEDWVVNASEQANWSDTEGGYVDPRLRAFFEDLFQGYEGEGSSLSDHYKGRYYELNDEHGITWEDSLRWCRSVRQEEPISREQVIDIFKI
jgi:hypothetical protein